MIKESDLLIDPSAEPTASPRDPFLTVMAGVLSVLFWSAVVGQYVLIVLWLESFFVEFKMKMPWSTGLVIHATRWGVPAIAIAAFVICAALGKLSRWAWPLLLIFFPLALNVLLGASLFFTYMEMPEGLSGGAKK